MNLARSFFCRIFLPAMKFLSRGGRFRFDTAFGDPAQNTYWSPIRPGSESASRKLSLLYRLLKRHFLSRKPTGESTAEDVPDDHYPMR
jgi:hypothetical protein